MKLKKALLVSLALALFCKGSEAGVAVRSPKQHACVNYSTAFTTATTGPGALYSVLLGTGAAGEFLVVIDSGNGTGLSTTGSSSLYIIPKISFVGNSSNPVSSYTVVNLDPPITFYNGLMVGDSANTGFGCVVFEQGRGLSGS